MRRFFIAMVLLVPVSLAAQAPSARGDANADNMVNATDVAFLAANILGSGRAADRACLADVNADATVNTKDIFRLIDVVFAEGTAPPPQPTEVCDGADNNCNAQTDENFNLQSDVSNCGACGNVCANLNAIPACTSGECNPTCTPGFASCDNNLANGCETGLNTNPSCLNASSLGDVAGDKSGFVTTTGRGEAWIRVRVREELNSVRDLRARVTLTVPADTNYDLYVYCQACGGTSIGSSTSTGEETVDVGNDDDGGIFAVDDTFNLFIEIRFTSAGQTGCGNWILRVSGDTGTGPNICDPP